jgi:hypothetical protein
MKKRELTAEQKQKSAERKEKLKALCASLRAMPKEQREALAMKCAAVITCEGRALSVHNQCMVAVQNPFATVIGGFNQWRKLGRSVRKGEHGLVIWAPAGESGGDSELQPPADGDGEKEKQRKRFLLVTMFDVAQTEEIGAAAPAGWESVGT